MDERSSGGVEELREAVLKLERAREHERALRVQAERVLDGVLEIAPEPTVERTLATIEGAFRMNHGEELLAAAVAGLGIAQAPEVMVADALARGELVRVLEGYTAPGPSVFAVIAPGRARSAIVRAFVEFVRATLA